MMRPHRSMTFSLPIGCWRLVEAAPSPHLAGMVDCYWEGEGHIEPFTERIVPNGHTELMFNLRGEHHLQSCDGHPTDTVFCTGWFSGLQRRQLTIHTRQGSHLLSARLKPWAAWRLFRSAAHTLAGRVELLDGLWGDRLADEMLSRLAEAQDCFARFNLLEVWIAARLDPQVEPDPLILHAAQRIAASSGTVRVADLAREVGLSRTRLSTRFREQIGVAPKQYARIARVRSIHRVLSHVGSQELGRVAQDHGYHDQAHFNRDFRDIVGLSPTQFLKQALPSVAP